MSALVQYWNKKMKAGGDMTGSYCKGVNRMVVTSALLTWLHHVSL